MNRILLKQMEQGVSPSLLFETANHLFGTIQY